MTRPQNGFTIPLQGAYTGTIPAMPTITRPRGHSTLHTEQMIAVRGIRERLLALAISEDEAKKQGFKPITQSWSLYQHKQAFELDEAVTGITYEFRLVLKTERGSHAGQSERISIWRRK